MRADYYQDEYDYLDPKLYTTTSDNLKATLEEHGLAVMDYAPDQIFSARGLLDLAQALGPPMLEDDPAVQSNVLFGSVLRLVTSHAQGAEDAQRPFSADELTMHMERALTSSNMQPSFLILGCIIPPNPGSGGMTLVNDMKNVVSLLTVEERGILSGARQRVLAGGRPIKVGKNFVLCAYKNRSYLSFRDFGKYGTDWDLVISQDIKKESVEELIAKAYQALYDRKNIRAIPWVRGRVVVVDNRRYFHARTKQVGPTDRELLRVRVL